VRHRGDGCHRKSRNHADPPRGFASRWGHSGVRSHAANRMVEPSETCEMGEKCGGVLSPVLAVWLEDDPELVHEKA
jgi:hypothetical protein